jgi:hypothetical protein
LQLTFLTLILNIKTSRILPSLAFFFHNTTANMQQPERLYRYNEEVDSSYAEPPVASSHSQWRDACADDACPAATSDDALLSENLDQLLQSKLQVVQQSLNFSCALRPARQIDFVKSQRTPDAGFLSPRSPATLSNCSTPRKFY